MTFWLVDEAVLSLAREESLDPLSTMIRRNQRSTSVRDTRNLVVGRVTELEEDPGGDGGDDEEGKGKKIVRKNFKTVPYYQATVVVPASGKVVLPITLSDDLTNFKVRAVAVSGAQRFGFKQTTLKVRLPVLVQPQLPRFVRVGDSFWAGGVARLVEGAEGPGTVDIKLTGALEGKLTSSEKIDLKNNKAQSVLTPVTVKTTPITSNSSVTVRVDVTRASDKAGDAFEVKLPLLPDRPMEKFVWYDTLQAGKTQMKPFPESPRPGSASQMFVVSGEPGVLELASAIEYLSGYPHGCLEQRMSQVSPDLALGGLLKKLELDTRFTPVMQGSVKKIIDDLTSHQDDAGFFSYWPGGKGDIALTAQGIEFLTLAKKAGVLIDDKVRLRAIDGLKKALRSDYPGLYGDYAYNQRTSALRALGRAGELDENYLIELFAKRKNFDTTSLADLTSAMSERPNVFATNLTSLTGELWDEVVLKQVKGKPVFDSLRSDRARWYGYYLGSPTSSTAAVLEALVRVDPKNPRLIQLRDGLLSKSNTWNGFGTTHDNRRAVAAIGTYLEKSQVEQPKITVSIPGSADAVLDLQKKGARRSVNGADPVSLTVNGGPIGLRAQYTYLPDALGDKVTPKKDGFVVSRSLTWLHPDNSAPTHHDDVPGASLSLGQGDVVEIHARLVNDEQRYHVALVVPIAAGLEPLNPALATSNKDAIASESDSIAPSYVQRLDHEVRYYFTELPKGSYGFHFRARASSEGKFVHPAPYAEMMYREEIRGRGAGMKIVVKGGHEK